MAASRGLAPTLQAPGANDQATRGSLAVSSVPMFLLQQHSLIDQAQDEGGGWVLAYRRLVSHIEFEGPLTLRALRKKGFTEEVKEAEKLMLRFRNRKSPFGSSPEYRPLDDDSDTYQIRVGDGLWSFVHGNHLQQAIQGMLRAANEFTFERATLPVSSDHSQLHEWLDLVGLMKFDSAFSNTAQLHTDKAFEEQATRYKELQDERAAAEALINGPPNPEKKDETEKPSGPTNRWGYPDWESEP